MDSIARKITNYLLENGTIDNKKYEICRYGLLTGMELFVCIMICFFISLYMVMVAEFIVVFLIFFSVRSYVGGLHMNSFKSCCICSCVVFLIILLAVKNSSLSLRMSLDLSICELCFLFILKPVENENRFVDEIEKKVFLKRVRWIMGIISGIVILLYSLKLLQFLNTITYTLSAIIFSMFLGNLKNKMERIKVNGYFVSK